MTGLEPPLDLQPDRAHGARIYDYILGGKDNYAIDREAAEAALAANPSTRAGMRANRAFLHRAARYLAAERGIRQFLDIGTGIPTSPTLHEVVQEIGPECRVVYVDNDPIVLAHARALLTSSASGRTAYIDSDMRDPGAILGAAELRATLDLAQPVALMLIGVVHFIPDADAYRLVGQLLDALAPGSFLVMSVLTDEFDPVGMAGVQRAYRERGESMHLRNQAQAEQFFAGLELVEPGLVHLRKWRPDITGDGSSGPSNVAMYAGVAVKPQPAT